MFGTDFPLKIIFTALLKIIGGCLSYSFIILL